MRLDPEERVLSATLGEDEIVIIPGRWEYFEEEMGEGPYTWVACGYRWVPVTIH